MQLEHSYSELQAAGAEAVAIVVAPLATVQQWCEGFKVQYPMLADSEHQVSEAYGVYDMYGGGLAGPAVFVVGQDGSIMWSHVGEAPYDYVAADVILAQLP